MVWLILIWTITQLTWWNIFLLEVVLIETFIRYYITSSKKWKRFQGCIVATVAQLLWVIIFMTTSQYTLLLLTFIDGCIWIRGIYRNWPKKKGRHKR
jgi:phosphatidylserine synthase